MMYVIFFTNQSAKKDWLKIRVNCLVLDLKCYLEKKSWLTQVLQDIKKGFLVSAFVGTDFLTSIILTWLKRGFLRVPLSSI